MSSPNPITSISFYSAIILLLIVACNEPTSAPLTLLVSPDSAKTVKTDSVKKDTAVVSPSSTTNTDSVPAVLLTWEKEMRNLGTTFALDKFYVSGMGDINLDNCYDWDGEIEEWYNPSPDGRYYIYVEPSWADGDADTYLFLMDVKAKKRCYLSVIGTCCSYWDCGWADDHTFIATGYNTYDAEDRYPNKQLTQGFYEVYDLETQSVVYYASRNYFKRPCDCGPSSVE